MTANDQRRTRRTVLELQRLPSGDWLATQAGEETEGRGPTAAAAAAAYCRRIHERDGGVDQTTESAEGTGAATST